MKVPRVVDHPARRRDIARAFAVLVAEQGLAVASYAKVATAAGCSVGAVQHYFATREEMVRAAFADLTAARDARIVALVQRGEEERRPIRAMLGEAMAQLLPLDPDRRREHAVTLQLRAAGLLDPDLAALAEASDADLRARVARALDNATRCGEAGAEVRPEPDAVALLALVQGLALAGPDAASERVVQAAVARLLPGRCRHHDR